MWCENENISKFLWCFSSKIERQFQSVQSSFFMNWVEKIIQIHLFFSSSPPHIIYESFSSLRCLDKKKSSRRRRRLKRSEHAVNFYIFRISLFYFWVHINNIKKYQKIQIFSYRRKFLWQFFLRPEEFCG